MQPFAIRSCETENRFLQGQLFCCCGFPEAKLVSSEVTFTDFIVSSANFKFAQISPNYVELK